MLNGQTKERQKCVRDRRGWRHWVECGQREMVREKWIGMEVMVGMRMETRHGYSKNG